MSACGYQVGEGRHMYVRMSLYLSLSWKLSRNGKEVQKCRKAPTAHERRSPRNEGEVKVQEAREQGKEEVEEREGSVHASCTDRYDKDSTDRPSFSVSIRRQFFFRLLLLLLIIIIIITPPIYSRLGLGSWLLFFLLLTRGSQVFSLSG